MYIKQLTIKSTKNPLIVDISRELLEVQLWNLKQNVKMKDQS